jgi:membrane protein required for colicin V production
MSALDGVLLVALAVFGLRGFFRGFVRETASLLAIVAGVAGVVFYAGPLAEILMQRGIAAAELALLAAGVGTFLGIYLAVTLAGWGIDRLAKAVFLGPVVRVLGIVFAIAKGAVVLGFALIVAQQWAPTVLNRERVEQSRLAPPMVALARTLVTEGEHWFAPQETTFTEGVTG